MNYRDNDINYWPCISDMFLVFFVMMMAIAITKGGYETAGDKFVIDDVVRDYQLLVEKVEAITPGRQQDLRACYYLPKGKYNFTVTDEEGSTLDPEPDSDNRPLLRQKILRLLQIINQESLYKRSKAYAQGSRFLNGMPRFERDGELIAEAYAFSVPSKITTHNKAMKELEKAFSNAIVQLQPSRDELSGEISTDHRYSDALRLLAFRVLYEPESNLRGVDSATILRKLCHAYDSDAGVNGNNTSADDYQQQLAEKDSKIAALQEENARMSALLKTLCSLTKVNQDSELEDAIRELLNRSNSGQNSTASFQQQIKTLQDEIAGLEAENQALKNEIKTLNAKIAGLEAENQALKNKSKSNEALNAKIRTLNDKISTLNARISTLNDKIKKLDQENNKLRKKNAKGYINGRQVDIDTSM